MSDSLSKKINVLVIPDLFPKFETDVQGVFVVDYLKCTAPYCNIKVLFVRLAGKKGLTIEKNNLFEVHRYCLSSIKISPFLKPLYYIKWFIKGYSIGKKFKETQIIHSHGTILGGTLAWLLSKKLKVPFIITEHQGPFSELSGKFWKRNWTRFSMQRANLVLAVSKHLKNEILETKIYPKRLEVTYNPVDTHLFSPLENNIKVFKNVLFVGRMDNFKGAYRSLQAFEKIASKYPEWTFTIVGDGEDMPLITQFLETHPLLKNKIILKGQKQKHEIAQEMNKADFLVNPSKNESFGLVIAEALSVGLPVIVGDTTAPTEFVNKDNGILIPAYDIDKIANAMETLITNLEQYDSAAIRNEIINRFSFDNFGKQMFTLYQSVLK